MIRMPRQLQAIRVRSEDTRPQNLHIRDTELVPIRLDRENGTDARQGVILVADTTAAVAEVAVDAAPAGDMGAVVRAGEGGPLRRPEVCFDGIEPGGVGGRGHRVDVQAPEQR